MDKLLFTRLESIMPQNLLIMLFSISLIFCLLCSFLWFLGMHYADKIYGYNCTFLLKIIMIGGQCNLQEQLEYKASEKGIKTDVTASICSNLNSYLTVTSSIHKIGLSLLLN